MWWNKSRQGHVRTHRMLADVLRKQEILMADFAKLKADVEAQTQVVASVKTLLDGLQATIADLKGKVSQDADTQKAIDDLAAQVEANSAALSAAVPQNTPAA